MSEIGFPGSDQLNLTAASPGSFLDPKARHLRLALGVVSLMALLLRFYSIGYQSVWIDEAYSLHVVAQPILSMIGETARDNHPPLYYLLLAVWMRLGPDTETWARSLSALLGLTFVTIFFLFCREIVAEPIALVATTLLALSPLAVWHSQDARMYSLMLVCVYLALTCLLVYLRRPNWGVFTAFVASLVLALYTHVYVVFLFPVIAVYLIWNRRTICTRSAWNVVLGLIMAGAAYLPWVWVVFMSAMHRAGFYKPISVLSIPYAFYAFSVGYSLGPSVAELHRSIRAVSIPQQQFGLITVTSFVFGITLLSGLVGVGRCRPGRDRFLLLVFGLPLLLPVLITLTSRIDFNVRYAAISFPAYLLLLAIGLVSLRGIWLRAVLGGGIVLLMGVSLLNYYTDQRYSKEDARAAVQWIKSRSTPQDRVLVIGVNAAFNYYQRPSVGSEWLDFREAERLAATEATLAQWSHEGQRLWFVTGRSWEDDPLDLALPTIRKYFDLVDEKSLPGLRVLELRSLSSSAGAIEGEKDSS